MTRSRIATTGPVKTTSTPRKILVMKKKKLTMLGAGSGFTISIAKELAVSPFFEGWEFCLMDIRMDNLKIMLEKIKPILDQAHRKLKITLTTSLEQALDGCDYVIRTIK